MKKLVLSLGIIILTFLSSEMVYAESYQRWIYWVNQPNYIATANDMSEIIVRLGRKEIVANSVYKLNSGITFKIPKPDLYLEYVLRSIYAADATIISIEKASKAVLYGDAVRWGNDIPYRVKNYFFSTVHNEVRFIGNYSGEEMGVFILLINGIPTIKLDCGNPLEVYSDGYIPEYTRSVKVADTIKIVVKDNIPKTDTTFVIIQLEEKEAPRMYPTTIAYYQESYDPIFSFQMTDPFFIPFVSAPCFSYYPYNYGSYGSSNVYVDNSSYYYNHTTTNNYRYTTNNYNDNRNYNYNRTRYNNGGPVSVPGHDDGGPSYVSGHGDNAGSNVSGGTRGKNYSTQSSTQSRSYNTGTSRSSQQKSRTSSAQTRRYNTTGTSRSNQQRTNTSSTQARGSQGKSNSNYTQSKSSGGNYYQARQSSSYRGNNNSRSYYSGSRNYSSGGRSNATRSYSTGRSSGGSYSGGGSHGGSGSRGYRR